MIRLTICAIFFLTTSYNHCFSATASYRSDIDWLIESSPVVVQGRVMRISKSINQSEVMIHVRQFLKGSGSNIILVITQSGKVSIDSNEPDFKNGEEVILYLNQTSSNNQGSYVVSNGLAGKKVIINDQVYYNDQNSFDRIDVEDYLKYLKEKLIKHVSI